MRYKKKAMTNFTRSLTSTALCLRPDNEQQLQHYLASHQDLPVLARGAGLSYGDSCFHSNGYVIETERLHHLLDFDSTTGLLSCQAAVTFADLFAVHAEFIPPVCPGTLRATLAGGIAHDVHGKNNHQEGSLGRHIAWLEVSIGDAVLRCSPLEHADLFRATIAGLGLTGIITRVGLYLKKAPRGVSVDTTAYTNLGALLQAMAVTGVDCDYQMAWLDLLQSTPRGLLAVASRCERPSHAGIGKLAAPSFSVPKLPVCLLSSWNMKLVNALVFHQKTGQQYKSLHAFNTPLDSVLHWNRVYGPKGLLQFQAVFPQDKAEEVILHLRHLIAQHRATPTLAVVKLFTQPGEGLLSFCKPGFTLAVDFINNAQAKAAILAMNHYMITVDGRVYLGKDLSVTAAQFERMYDQITSFKQVLAQYACHAHSDLGKRLGLCA